jgi:uncharacterized protein (UPF0333 family)
MNKKKNKQHPMQRKNITKQCKNSKAQVAMEFMILMTLGVAILIILIIAVGSISKNKTDEKTYYELDDFGNSIQQELILAAELEDGYTRIINIPTSINGRKYNITTGSAGDYAGYLNIDYMTTTIYYPIPVVNGTLQKGYNKIRKENGSVFIIQ